MDGSSTTRGSGGGLHGGVLSGGPRAEIPLDHRDASRLRALGPAALWWAPPPGDPSVGAGLFLPGGGGLEDGAAEPFRCTPVLVAYPRSGAAPNVYYAVLGGRAHLDPDNGWREDEARGGLPFRPDPDLVFTLGVELPSPMAQRLGHSSAATSVRRGAPGYCRGSRLVALVGSRPRLALQSLGQQLLSWKEFPKCPFDRS